jgi:hypothetical protein
MRAQTFHYAVKPLNGIAHFPVSSVASSCPQPVPTKHGQVVPMYAIKAYEKVEVYFHSFLNLALGEGCHLNYIAPQKEPKVPVKNRELGGGSFTRTFERKRDCISGFLFLGPRGY